LLGNYILFTSREFDFETGLYYNRARHLDPTTGRWTTQDPLGFAAGDANLYRYVGNRATLATDPSGNLAWFVAVPLVMSVGGFTWLTGSTALVSYRTTGSWWDAGTWGACWDGLRLGIQANVNGLASAARSLLTLGVWNEPWEVWVVDEVDRPYYNDAFLAARFGWELLPTAGIGRLTQAPGQMGRWGRWALGWDAGQNAVQAGRGGWDIDQHGLTWGNSLQVVGSLLGLGGNYATWRRLPAGGRQVERLLLLRVRRPPLLLLRKRRQLGLLQELGQFLPLVVSHYELLKYGMPQEGLSRFASPPAHRSSLQTGTGPSNQFVWAILSFPGQNMIPPAPSKPKSLRRSSSERARYGKSEPVAAPSRRQANTRSG
jgi:RHS repeat-associated protein